MVVDHLEPGAQADGDLQDAPNEAIALSIAISLKRIADVLADGHGFANMEQLAWSMGQAFERGRGAA